MAGFGDIPLKAGFTSMGELADLMMEKRKMEQAEKLKRYEIEQMAPYKTAQMNYQKALTDSMGLRYLTPQGKALLEQSHLKQGGSPAGTNQGKPIVPGTLPYYDPERLQNTGQPQNPGNQNNNGQLQPVNFNDDQFFGENSPNGSNPNGQNPPNQAGDNTIQDFLPDNNNQAPPNGGNSQATSADQYSLKNAKTNIPAQVLSKNLYATNIDKTLDAVNVNDLTYYNNPLGYVKLKFEEGQDALGLPTSDKYKKYKEAEGAFDFLANQVRQFYGDSIQPSAMAEKVKKLDPRSGFKSADIAKTRFSSQKKLLKNELQTYRDATKNADVYTGGRANNEDQVEGMAAPPGNVWMMTPEGDKVPVHKDNIDYAIKTFQYKKVE